jgi:hypothetical protein
MYDASCFVCAGVCAALLWSTVMFIAGAVSYNVHRSLPVEGPHPSPRPRRWQCDLLLASPWFTCCCLNDVDCVLRRLLCT